MKRSTEYNSVRFQFYSWTYRFKFNFRRIYICVFINIFQLLVRKLCFLYKNEHNTHFINDFDMTHSGHGNSCCCYCWYHCYYLFRSLSSWALYLDTQIAYGNWFKLSWPTNVLHPNEFVHNAHYFRELLDIRLFELIVLCLFLDLNHFMFICSFEQQTSARWVFSITRQELYFLGSWMVKRFARQWHTREPTIPSHCIYLLLFWYCIVVWKWLETIHAQSRSRFTREPRVSSGFFSLLLW